MKVQGTSIGLDVHARSVVGCGLDGDTGEVFQRRLCPDHREVLGWVNSLPAPVAVTYEAGPTGFGLARAVICAGMNYPRFSSYSVARAGVGWLAWGEASLRAASYSAGGT